MPRHLTKEAVEKANIGYRNVWDMSIPAKKIRVIKEFNVDEPEVVEHGRMKLYPWKSLEFSGATTNPNEVADAVTWRKIYKGKPSKCCANSF